MDECIPSVTERVLLKILLSLLVLVPFGGCVGSIYGAMYPQIEPTAQIERREGQVTYLSTRLYTRLSDASYGTHGYRRGYGRRIAAHANGTGERHFYHPGGGEEIRLVTPDGRVVDRLTVGSNGKIQ